MARYFSDIQRRFSPNSLLSDRLENLLPVRGTDLCLENHVVLDDLLDDFAQQKEDFVTSSAIHLHPSFKSMPDK